MKFMAQTIVTAHRLSPASWGITLRPDRIAVNVGGVVVLQVLDGKARMTLSKHILKTLPKQAHDLITLDHHYNFVKDAHEGLIAQRSFPRLFDLGSAHTDLVERAALKRKMCFWPHAHSPSVVAVLRKHGHDVAAPEYYKKDGRGVVIPIAVDSEEWIGFEGTRLLKLHKVIERKPELVRKKKELVLRMKGRLECEVCGFDFVHIYGSIGQGFAEVHHLLPLKDLGHGRNVRLPDLAVVCSNCHRMLHRGNPVLQIDELKGRIKEARDLNAE